MYASSLAGRFESVVLFALLILPALSTSAQNAQLDQEDPFVQQAVEYAKIFGISHEEAVSRLQLLRADPDLEATLIAYERVLI